MKIAVFGATGMIGSQISVEAISRGHEVTAVTRTGKTVPDARMASPFAADMGDAAAVASLAATHDAIVLATGPSRTGGDHQVWLEALATALDNVGSTRTLIVGGAGALMVGGARLVDLPGFPEAYKSEALTLAAAYSAVKDLPESVNWTMQAPAPEIGPGVRSGKYVMAGDSP